ncbi:hypothetical protein CERZMDRAFT_122303 [Cercospora zeae-maydis SCOH1-5]|uniref:AB hydrolase-1 domain-containing protein n=1 Tax=Cercospora zeae-maydis SCOH1-5 TaxID=717836 RepID=A0A6A6F4S1_9PEZI|nr:hypothetical protein CERZMDRAFT_122303 [Cercospora zeae-maydis SCOH1-5]
MHDYTNVTNENWRGKNDPAERRRIQNRINQRAFRQRQREGESTKITRSKSPSGSAASTPLVTVLGATNGRSDALYTSASQSNCGSNAPGSRQYDDLARLINRNFYAAAYSNARSLGIKKSSIQRAEIGLTSKAAQVVPKTLTPITAQYQVAHDYLIDILPHARIKYNIIRATTLSQIDAALLCDELRCSGALEHVDGGGWQRCGLIVWGDADQMHSWEISAGFMQRWAFLLEGCEDLVAVTNAWRAQRGEPCFPESRASSAVLTSIIDSLDRLGPLPDIHTPDHFSETASRRSYPESLNRSVASTASIHKNTISPGFGVEYGGQLELDDVDGTTHAALPPTVPTSRPPSGLSVHQVPRRESSRKSASLSSSMHHQQVSRKSSRGSVASAGSPRNTLSSESWLRKSTSKGGDDDDSASTRGRSVRKSRLKGVSSYSALRMEENWPLSRDASEDSGRVSLGDHIVTKAPAPPPAAGRGRIFLSDATIDEDRADITSPPLVNSNSFGTRSGGSDSKASERLSVSGSSLKSPSPIEDSIPTRFSSLRLSSSSPAGKKKHKKSKRRPASGSTDNKMGYRPSSPILESSWADLGDDDETVRRIRQLREQRKSRIQEESVLAEATEPDPRLMPSRDATPQRSASERRTSSPDDSARKARKLQRPVHRHDVDPPAFSLDIQRPASQRRPQTAKSVDRPSSPRLSLDYPYAQAADLFQNESRDHSRSTEHRSRDSSAPAPATRRENLDTPAKPSSLSSASRSMKKKSRRMAEEKLLTGHHPDLPLTLDKRKNRRKSMNDARVANSGDKDVAASRRDSIDEAISEYLQAPRLNRRVRSQAGGRTIAYSEVGDPNGAAVFICVGMGLTRYVTAFYDELAATLRLRLITIDRPGVGGSDSYPQSDKSGPLNWPEDILTICQHLGIVKFSILAHSAGAVYALATALILPHLIRGKVHLLAPWVPPSQLEAISHPTSSAPPANPLPRSQRFLRVLPTPFLKAANASFMTATSASLKPVTKRTNKSTPTKSSPRRQVNGEDPISDISAGRERPEYNRRESMMLMDQFMPSTNPLDNFPIPIQGEEQGEQRRRRSSLVLTATATPMDPSFAYASIGLHAAEHAEKARQVEYTSRLTQATWDMATRDSNPATDLLVCLERHRDVGFRYTDVAREVVITHGSEDKRVPVANVKWLAEQMNRRALGVTMERGSGRESRDSCASTARGGCEVRILEGEGHGLMASPVIMGDILEEIARTAYERESLQEERRS